MACTFFFCVFSSQAGESIINDVRQIALLFLLFLSATVVAQEKYALLIGIGQYSEDSGWNPIHGDNDIPIIKTFLIGNGFSPENIDELKNSNATKGGIMESLEKLRMKASQGDVVYIHFSGHGQQITDLNGDEKDGYDEAWIPYDAKKRFEQGEYEGQSHIIDDELNVYLNGLRAKVGPRGKIVVITDACHSGSGSRGAENDDEYVRGTGEVFTIPHEGANIIRKDSPVLWLFVGACKSYQTNHEVETDDGIYYGSLSYIISNSDGVINESSYSDVVKVWQNELNKISHYPQTLDNEGRPSNKSKQLF